MTRRLPRPTLFPYTTLFRSLPTTVRCSTKPPISWDQPSSPACWRSCCSSVFSSTSFRVMRSEEHTSELQSRRDLVCRLLLEKLQGFEHRTEQFQVPEEDYGQ